MTARAIFKKAYKALEKIETLSDKNLVSFIKKADTISLEQLFNIEEEAREINIWPLNEIKPDYEGLLEIARLILRDVSEVSASTPEEYYRQVKKIVGDGLSELDGLIDDYELK